MLEPSRAGAKNDNIFKSHDDLEDEAKWSAAQVWVR